MTTPIRPLPHHVAHWTSRLRWLRWADAVAAWLVALLALAVLVPRMPSRPAMAVAAGALVALSLLSRVRATWRPVSATTTVLLSRGLRPGDRAWFVHGGAADLVLVTALHRLRVVIARPDHEAAEGMSVRRTRVLLLPAPA